jgi:glucose/arabinose dehydrogenase
MGHHRGVKKLSTLAVFLLTACSATQTATPTPSAASPTPTPALATETPSAQASPSGQPTDTPQPTSTGPTETPSATPSGSAPSSDSPSATPPQGAFNPDAVALSIEQIASGYPPLTFLTNAADGSGRIFLVQQRGVIVTIDSAGVETGQFMDISDRIRSGGEQGLLGLAFHPDFESNGRFFVNYTARNSDSVTSEFALDSNGNGDPASERVLFTIDDPYPNHNGGMLAFGPDGYLYLGMGDGGSGGDPQNAGQSLNTMLGKMLRVDVNSGDPYGIPADNPFAGGGRGLPEIWSYGLRNPWRFSFDRETGGMFIGDVGQSAREEIDVEPAGEGGRNYGWRIMEGDLCSDDPNCNRRGLTLPAASYGRDDGSCSVTGGYVYRGAQFPSLYGAYVFSDYCSGVLWAFDAEAALATGRADMVELGQSGVSPSSFGEDEAGEIYLVGHGGAVYHLVATER